MFKKNTNGSYSQKYSISLNNPEAKQNDDWFDDLCKKYDTKNYWKKKSKKGKNEEKIKKEKSVEN